MKYIALIALAVTLTACGGAPEKVKIETKIVTKDNYIAVQVDEKYTDKDACPSWPKKADYIKHGLATEQTDYLYAAFKAWSCEYKTRIKIGDEQKRIKADVDNRNKIEK